ncbi:retropepsin-like aspartic protease family protein [Aurantiacibacter arachoides]|uniref:retropepsin-like aspartic protease family protein n=1 Tax=Aurantiacibacter arachoides TaxID=1850444 RepID=UPI001F4576EF|nr:TIGR02281 family clan AA aspartic protease [Aurantiacibacter arachoides]
MLLIGGAIGLLMPAGEAVPGAVATQPAPSADPSPALARADAVMTWEEETEIHRERDGHFYADAVIDGTPTRMLVDTGASVIALTGEDASALGLTWDESQIAPVAHGASGPVYGVHTQLGAVRVGAFEAENVAAMIIPEGLGVSLLGQSFLSTIASVRIADDRMVLAS